MLREVTTHFIVDARAHSNVGGGHVKARIINPSGNNTDIYITDKGDGTYRLEYTAYEDGRTSEKRNIHSFVTIAKNIFFHMIFMNTLSINLYLYLYHQGSAYCTL